MSAYPVNGTVARALKLERQMIGINFLKLLDSTPHMLKYKHVTRDVDWEEKRLFYFDIFWPECTECVGHSCAYVALL